MHTHDRNHEIVQSCSVPAEVRATAHNGHNRHTHTCIDTLRIFAYSIVINVKAYLFSRKVFALETFFPIAEAFQEKYEPDGSTYIKNKIAPKNNLQFSPLSLKSNGVVLNNSKCKNKEIPVQTHQHTQYEEHSLISPMSKYLFWSLDFLQVQHLFSINKQDNTMWSLIKIANDVHLPGF